MTIQKAGTRLDYTITYLEMAQRPSFGWPRLPPGATAALLRAEGPPVWYFMTLYDAVGRDYAWEDMHSWDEARLAARLGAERLVLYTLLDRGWPQGFFMLEWDGEGTTDLAYLGIVPEATGGGLGGWLLRTAILTAWDVPGTDRVTVNTCSLDHPRALALYQKNGFTPVRREDRTRILLRDRNLSRIPT